MKHVEIFTNVSCEGNPGPGSYSVVLSYHGKTKELSASFEKSTGHRIELAAMIAALSALKERCSVTFYSRSEFVENAINRKWVDGWEKNGWKKADDEKLKNSDLWAELHPLLRLHEIKIKNRGKKEGDPNTSGKNSGKPNTSKGDKKNSENSRMNPMF